MWIHRKEKTTWRDPWGRAQEVYMILDSANIEASELTWTWHDPYKKRDRELTVFVDTKGRHYYGVPEGGRGYRQKDTNDWYYHSTFGRYVNSIGTPVEWDERNGQWISI